MRVVIIGLEMTGHPGREKRLFSYPDINGELNET